MTLPPASLAPLLLAGMVLAGCAQPSAWRLPLGIGLRSPAPAAASATVAKPPEQPPAPVVSPAATKPAPSSEPLTIRGQSPGGYASPYDTAPGSTDYTRGPMPVSGAPAYPPRRRVGSLPPIRISNLRPPPTSPESPLAVSRKAPCSRALVRMPRPANRCPLRQGMALPEFPSRRSPRLHPSTAAFHPSHLPAYFKAHPNISSRSCPPPRSTSLWKRPAPVVSCSA